MTHSTKQFDTARLDDDPSVAGSGLGSALLSRRQTWTHQVGLRLECGIHLAPITVAYETWGTLDADGENAIFICHALTGDAHAAGKYSHSDRKAGWWDALIGPGRAFDTDHYFVVCANVLGGCQGTTGPSSPAPEHPARQGQPYGSRFPQVTVRDIVRLQRELLRELGVTRLAAVAGGSLGGMQVLEWLVMYPDFVAAAIPIAASLAHSAHGIGFNLVGREAIMRDAAWAGGDYYLTGKSPDAGLAIARMVGMLTYQSEESMRRKFHREQVATTSDAGPRPNGWAEPATSTFQVESYLRYQGQSLVERFDANSYLVLSRAMDLHDIGRERGGLDAALARVSPDARTLVVGINSDVLFPLQNQRETVARLRSLGCDVRYHELDSPWGHDAFLIEHEQLGEAIGRFFKEDHA